MKTRTLYLFRHGQTDWNAAERFQGHTDIPLNDIGREQARQLIPYFRENSIDAVLSSDLTRASETAKIIADALFIPVYQHYGLREAHLGAAQGLTRVEIETNLGEELAKRWRSSHVSDADVSYPGGETGKQVLQRSFRAIEDFLLAHPWTKIGVATHGGVIRRIMHQLLPPNSPDVQIPNTVVYRICYDTENCRFHLSD